jgi:hypothetical protein
MTTLLDAPYLAIRCSGMDELAVAQQKFARYGLLGTSFEGICDGRLQILSKDLAQAAYLPISADYARARKIDVMAADSNRNRGC